MVKVLVLMASYNGEKYIKEQINSILEQKNVAVEILISDDKSSDNTIPIVETMISQGLPIKLIKRKVGTGSAARNFISLIKEVSDVNTFNAVAFSDQDDIWLPEKLDTAIRYLQSGSIDLYISNLILWDEKANKRSIIRKSFKQRKFDFLFEGGSAGCTYVFNVNLLRCLKTCVESLDFHHWQNFSHDWFVYFIARLNGFRVFIDEVPLILYRIHENNVHGHLNTSSFTAIRERIKLVKNGWYLGHIEGFLPLLKPGTPERNIYELYKKGFYFRLYLLFRYNFQLIRDPLKFFQFALLSLLPYSQNSKQI